MSFGLQEECVRQPKRQRVILLSDVQVFNVGNQAIFLSEDLDQNRNAR